MLTRLLVKKYGWIILTTVLTAALLSACSLLGGTSPKTLTGADKDAVLAYSEPIADDLLAGYSDKDYAAFSKDFNDTMKKGLSEQYFNSTLLPTVFDKIGKYQSRTVESVTQSANYVTVIYNAKFENDDPVVIRLSLDPNDPHQVSGLYFDSVKLRQK
jgi:hypothetical protein